MSEGKIFAGKTEIFFVCYNPHMSERRGTHP